MKDKGIMAIVVPEGLLQNATTKYIRKYILSHSKVLGIISLPQHRYLVIK